MVDILAFGAHPDDIEFGCGGILVKASSQGKQIVMVDLTSGEKATNGTPSIRRREAQQAAKVIKAKRLYLDFKDCEIFDTYEGRVKLVKVIREYKPRLILAPFWKGEQTHPDHLACGVMSRYACRYARFAQILPEWPPHRPEGILHYPSSLVEQIHFLVDVSDHWVTWKQMMDCHKSQMQTFPYSEWVLRNAAALGTWINRPYAQGLVTGNPVVIDDLDFISHGAREI
jgi:bacillithiol biosynthesis deacetylase BshB1